ncbi:helix-turn-helix domain-containing protein [Desulfobacterales bacterium HSG2]|nr:helix-turn-helix domain-containing protein [Desulfobacterales bacterium HSG2]
MRESVRKAIGETVRDMLRSGLKPSFTKKELDSLGVEIQDIRMAKERIRAIRKRMNLSQTVFAKMLNVSPSSVRHWEQGNRRPRGSAVVLLELPEKSPHVLDYRLS